jgi:hypothetical protein
MKACPLCNYEPSWHYCRNVTFAKKDLHFAFCGCTHVANFVGDHRFIPVADADRPAYEARWDAAAEELFTAYTARWPESARIAFRSRLWPAPLPVIQPALLNHIRATAPAAKQADDDCPW